MATANTSNIQLVHRHFSSKKCVDPPNQWFPTGGSRPQSGLRRSFCGVTNGNLNSLLKSRIFRTSYINIYVTLAKPKHSLILMKFTLFSIIIPIWFLLCSFNRPGCRTDSCTGRVNPHRLRVPAFVLRVVLGAVRAQDEKFFVWVTEFWAKTHELDQLKNRKARGCTKVVYQHCG